MYTVTACDSPEDLPDGALGATGYPAQRNFFLSREWFDIIFEDVLRDEGAPRIYLATAGDGALAGALFCIADRSKHVLRSMTCFYSIEYSVSVAAGVADAAGVAEAIAAFIASESPRWAVIELRYLQLDGEVSAALLAGLDRHGFAVETYFQNENWWYDGTDDTFDTYYAARPSRLRNTVKRKTKQCSARHQVRIAVYSEDDERLAGAIDDYVSVYNRSWKQQEPYANFTPDLIRLAARLGILRLGILYADEQAVAAQIWLEMNGRSVIYKLAYDENFKQLSVGSILSRELFEQAFARGQAGEIDYGVGSEGYKQDWMSNVRRIGGIQAFNKKTSGGLLRIIVRSIRSAVSRIVHLPRRRQ